MFRCFDASKRRNFTALVFILNTSRLWVLLTFLQNKQTNKQTKKQTSKQKQQINPEELVTMLPTSIFWDMILVDRQKSQLDSF